jgi:hypothetical protein
LRVVRSAALGDPDLVVGDQDEVVRWRWRISAAELERHRVARPLANVAPVSTGRRPSTSDTRAAPLPTDADDRTAGDGLRRR